MVTWTTYSTISFWVTYIAMFSILMYKNSDFDYEISLNNDADELFDLVMKVFCFSLISALVSVIFALFWIVPVIIVCVLSIVAFLAWITALIHNRIYQKRKVEREQRWKTKQTKND